ncbi:MAG TPA: YtxH domain-containing protein [Polyangiaceae bacterium]|nr:YtxH domain-containing protein [Polyangiaceae bacterium]
MMHGTVKDTMKAVRDVGTDDILSALGLERRRGPLGFVLPAISYFAAGLAVGAGVTLLIAPKTGRQMRRELGEKVRHVGSQLSTAAESAVHEFSQDNGRNRSEESPVRRTTSVSPKS